MCSEKLNLKWEEKFEVVRKIWRCQKSLKRSEKFGVFRKNLKWSVKFEVVRKKAVRWFCIQITLLLVPETRLEMSDIYVSFHWIQMKIKKTQILSNNNNRKAKRSSRQFSYWSQPYFFFLQILKSFKCKFHTYFWLFISIGSRSSLVFLSPLKYPPPTPGWCECSPDWDDSGVEMREFPFNGNLWCPRCQSFVRNEGHQDLFLSLVMMLMITSLMMVVVTVTVEDVDQWCLSSLTGWVRFINYE